MSRYSIKNIDLNEEKLKKIWEDCSPATSALISESGRYNFVYGLDHACGWFCQIVPLDENNHEIEEEEIDLDGMFTGFTGAELGFLLNLFGGNPQHIELAYLDYGF